MNAIALLRALAERVPDARARLLLDPEGALVVDLVDKIPPGGVGQYEAYTFEPDDLEMTPEEAALEIAMRRARRRSD